MDYPNLDDVKNDIAKDALYVYCEGDSLIGVATAGKDDELEHLECWSKDMMNRGEINWNSIYVKLQLLKK